MAIKQKITKKRHQYCRIVNCHVMLIFVTVYMVTHRLNVTSKYCCRQHLLGPLKNTLSVIKQNRWVYKYFHKLNKPVVPTRELTSPAIVVWFFNFTEQPKSPNFRQPLDVRNMLAPEIQTFITWVYRRNFQHCLTIT